MKNLLHEGILVLPWAFNAITAKITEARGFKAIYVSGADAIFPEGLETKAKFRFPLTDFRVMLKSVKDAMTELKTSGTQKNLLDKMFTAKNYTNS